MASTTGTTFDRDEMARWYAKRHLDTDMGVERILFLPTNAPPRQIRFLEINRLISETTPLEPVDFGVDIDGANAHALFVLDVTPDQWEAIGRGEIQLPAGWTTDGMQELGRR